MPTKKKTAPTKKPAVTTSKQWWDAICHAILVGWSPESVKQPKQNPRAIVPTVTIPEPGRWTSTDLADLQEALGAVRDRWAKGWCDQHGITAALASLERGEQPDPYAHQRALNEQQAAVS